LTRDGCIIVVHQIQVLCCYISRQAAVDYVFRGNSSLRVMHLRVTAYVHIPCCHLTRPIALRYITFLREFWLLARLNAEAVSHFYCTVCVIDPHYDRRKPLWRLEVFRELAVVSAFVQYQKQCELFLSTVVAKRIQRRSKSRTQTHRRRHAMLWPPLPRRLSFAVLVQTCSPPPTPTVEAQRAKGHS